MVGRRSMSPTSEPERERAHRRDGRRDRDRRCRPLVRRRAPDDQQVARVRRRRDQPDLDAEDRVRAVRAAADDPGDQHDPEQHHRDREDHLAARPLPEHQPRDDGDDHDLDVAHHRPEARADDVDGVVERDQVGGEADARDRAQDDRPAAHRAERAPLRPRHEHEDRQPVQAAEEHAGRRRHVRRDVEDPRERDRERPEDRRRPRMRDRRRERVHAASSCGRSVHRPRPPVAGRGAHEALGLVQRDRARVAAAHAQGHGLHADGPQPGDPQPECRAPEATALEPRPDAQRPDLRLRADGPVRPVLRLGRRERRQPPASSSTRIVSSSRVPASSIHCA